MFEELTTGLLVEETVKQSDESWDCLARQDQIMCPEEAAKHVRFVTKQEAVAGF